MTRKVAIIGAGKTALLAAEIFRENGLEVVGFFVEEAYVNEATSEKLKGYVDAIENLESCLTQNPGAGFFVAVGYQNLNQERRRLASIALETKSTQLSCISNGARISNSALLKPGVLVGPFVDVQVDAVIQEGSFLWSSVTVGHGSLVEQYCWVAAGATIGGDSQIGASSFLGLNSVIGHDVVVGEGCLIGSGVSVTSNLDAGSAAMNGSTQIFARGAQRLSKIIGI